MTHSPRRFRAVLFDLGGTLVDTRDFPTWTAEARRLGLELDPDALPHFLSEAVREWDRPQPPGDFVEFWRRVLSEAAGTALDRSLAERFTERIAEVEPPPALYSDVARCLDELERGHRRLGVVSNSRSEQRVRDVLRRCGVGSRFAAVVSSGSEGVRKPEPRIFRRATELLGVPESEAFFVGDLLETDVRGARGAGLSAIWLNRSGTGMGHEEPEITSLLELPPHLAHLERIE